MRRYLHKRHVHVSALAVILLTAGITAISEQAPADSRSSGNALTSSLPVTRADAPPPSGFISFCVRNPAQCRTSAESRQIALTAENWRTVREVHRAVNDAITPRDDQEHYGRAEYWAIPHDGYGDCEDYVLAKRARLIAHGFPHSALRIAVVDTPGRLRHAVLVVATDRGDYVLDNLDNQVRPWKDSRYTWIEQQNPDDPWKWIAMQSREVVAEAARQPLSLKR